MIPLPAYKSKLKYDKEYKLKYTIRKEITFNKNTESDMIKFLESKGEYSTYVKSLIRKQIKKESHADEKS